jgi:polar amino acid transport system substrate-binding protein
MQKIIRQFLALSVFSNKPRLAQRLNALGASLLVLLAFGLAGCAAPVPAASPTLAAGVIIPPSDKIIRYAVFPAPPYMIGADDEQAVMRGIDVAIVQEIARQLGREVVFVRCPWARCLELMKSGEVDLLSSAYKKPEREEYMLYFSRPFLDKLPIAFYTLKTRPVVIDAYEDIYQLETVGVLRGASYFQQFDQDAKVKKFEVASQDQLFPMLLAGRLDAIAGYMPTENYRLKMEGYGDKIELSTYVYEEQAFVYMTVSKKSPLADIFAQVDRINTRLVAEGFITKIVNQYYDEYR